MPPPKDPVKREEWRRKIAQSLLGKSPFGIKGTPEYESKVQKARIGHEKFRQDKQAHTDWKQRLSIAKRRRNPRPYLPVGFQVPRRIIVFSAEVRQRISEAAKSRSKSPAHLEALRNASARRRGIPQRPESIAKMVATRNLRGNYTVPQHVRDAVGLASRTRRRTPEEREKIAAAFRGKKRDPEIGRKAGATRLARRTKPYPEKRGKDPRYKPWRNAVLERDSYTCQRCRKIDKSNHAHHIQEWSIAPDLRYSVENAITLCDSCHLKTHHEERRKQRAVLQ